MRVHLRRIAVFHWWLDRCLAGCSGTDRESRPYSFGGRFSIRAVTSQQMSDDDVCTASQTCSCKYPARISQVGLQTGTPIGVALSPEL